MDDKPTGAESETLWTWLRLRGRRRRELDRLQKDLVKRVGEKREYAGDPNQPRHFWVRTKNR